MAYTLTDIQKSAIAQWTREGMSIADIQKRILAEFGQILTFMEARLLLVDLGATVKDRPAPVHTPTLQAAPKPGAAPGAGQPAAGATDADWEAEDAGGGAAGGGVTVALDRIMKPGSVVSGSVTFSDGVTAQWSLDTMGRLGLAASRPGYRPSPEDVQDFQLQLRDLLARQGY